MLNVTDCAKNAPGQYRPSPQYEPEKSTGKKNSADENEAESKNSK